MSDLQRIITFGVGNDKYKWESEVAYPMITKWLGVERDVVKKIDVECTKKVEGSEESLDVTVKYQVVVQTSEVEEAVKSRRRSLTELF